MTDKLRIRARLPDDLLETIAQMAKEQQVSLSAVIEELLRDALNPKHKRVFLVYPTKNAPVAVFVRVDAARRRFNQELLSRGMTPERELSIEELNKLLPDLHIAECKTD
jgi:hypothetical protein